MPAAPPSAHLIEQATRAVDRAERDAAFAALLRQPTEATTALRAALAHTHGIMERQDRIRSLATDPQAALRHVELLAEVAIVDTNYWVRLEACQGLIEAGEAGLGPLLKAYDAARRRGEAPWRTAQGCIVTTIMRAICLAGGEALSQLTERVRHTRPAEVGKRFVDLLVECARIRVLEELANTLARDRLSSPDEPVQDPVYLHAVEALLRHGQLSDPVLWNIATYAPITRLRIQALDAIPAASADRLAALDRTTVPGVRAPDSDLTRAVCRLWIRSGAEGQRALRAVAASLLPNPSPAWWSLLEVEPEWCAEQVVMHTRTTALRLLPGTHRHPDGATTLLHVAASEATLPLRAEATRRLLLLGASNSPSLIDLWFRVRRETSPDSQAIAAMVEAELETLLCCSPTLQLCLDAIPTPDETHARDHLVHATHNITRDDSPLTGAGCAGLLYHSDARERLVAAVGLCQHPMPSLAAPLVQRAVAESDATLRSWLLAAAWMAVGASDDGSPTPKALADRLTRANPILADVLRPPEPEDTEPGAAQLAEWLAMDPPARVEALIELSRTHRGRKLTRVQARDLSRALTQPGRARHIVGLLRSPDKPWALARALLVARRAGAGRSRQLEAATQELEEARLMPEQERPEPTPTESSEAYISWDLPPSFEEFVPFGAARDGEPGPGGEPTISGHRLDETDPVAPVRADIAVAVGRFIRIADRQEADPRMRESTQLRDTLSPQERQALIKAGMDGQQRAWADRFVGAKLGTWPDDRPFRLHDPMAMFALQQVADASRVDPNHAAHFHPFGTVCERSWTEALRTAPPAEPELSHLSELLFFFGQAFPDRLLGLLEQSCDLHPHWHPILLAAYLSDPIWNRRDQHNHTDERATHAVDTLSRTTLSEHHRSLAPHLPRFPQHLRLPTTQHRELFPAPDGAVHPAAPPLPDPYPGFDPMRAWDATPMLAAGAWTLGQLDYPSFRVVARSGFASGLGETDNQLPLRFCFAVPALFRRLLEHGRPTDLLRLVWGRDCLVTRTGWEADITTKAVTDYALRLVYEHWEDGPDALPPPDEPQIAAVRTPAELDALPPDALPAIARGLPPAERGLPWAVLRGLGEPGLPRDPDHAGPVLGTPPTWWDAPERETIVQQVVDDARAYVVLRSERPGQERIARRTLRRFWRRPDASGVPSLQVLRDQHGPDRVLEGLILGLFIQMTDGAPPSSTARAADKQCTIRAMRQLSLAWEFDEPDLLTRPLPLWFDDPWLTEEEAHAALRTLHRTLEVVPREVAVAIGLTDAQGLPTLLGGARTLLERSMAEHLQRMAPVLDTSNGSDTPATVFELRPLTKVEALSRGDRAGDCSSGTVPFRCMSPHHTYYGVYRDGVPQRGYLTLVEAWLETPEQPPEPSLVLETVNIPISIFDFVQLDLVHIVEAIAQQRGLAPRIGLVHEWWAWNYSNRDTQWNSRPARGGAQARLHPADPCIWSVYRSLMPRESNTYTPFRPNQTAIQLLPTDPNLDSLQPENIAEAARIRALPRKTPIPTVTIDDQMVGFISSLPSPGGTAPPHCAPVQ